MTAQFTPQEIAFYKAFLEKFPGKKTIKSDTEATVRCPDPDSRHTNGDRNPSLGVGLSRNGSGPEILLNCRSQGCDHERILNAVGLGLNDLYFSPNGRGGYPPREVEIPGCTLEEYAAYKNLPIEFLAGDEVALEDDTYAGKPAVLIPYADEEGNELPRSRRWRTGLQKTTPDTRMRSLSRAKGGELTLYGRHGIEEAKRAGYVLLVEGESDCHTAWYHGLPAVGVPGAQNWRDEWGAYLDGIPAILVCVETDNAGEDLWKKVSSCEVLRGRIGRVDFSDAF